MMRGLTGSGILAAWEAGQGLHPLDRALSVLRAGYPEADREALASLTVGQRDAMLLELRRGTFGDALVGFAACDECGERLEFSLPASGLPAPASSLSGEIDAGGYQVRFRLPTSHDLASIARSGEGDTARGRLVERCVIDASRGEERVEGSALPDEVIARLAEAMAELDPAADLVLRFACPACGHAWPAVLDIEQFFWAEVTAKAQRLLGEVHTLARAYGWDEARILEMSAVRRQAYLDRVGA